MAKEDKKLKGSLRLLARSSFIVLIGVVLSKIFTYSHKIIIARWFGAEIYGVYSLAFMIVWLFATIGMLGFSEGLIRYISLYRGEKEKNKIAYLLRFSIPLSFVAGLVAFFILFVLSEKIGLGIFNSYELVTFLKIMGLAIPILILVGLFLAVIRAFEMIALYSFIVNIFQNGLRLFVLILLIFFGLEHGSIPLSFLAAALVTLIISFYGLKRATKEIPKKIDIKESERKDIRTSFLSYSWPIAILGIINSLFYWTDSFFIGYYINATNVGLYNAAISIIALFSIVPDLFSQLFFPLVVKEFGRKNYELIRQTTKQIIKWNFMLNIPIFIAIFAFPGVFINLLFGKEFLVSVISLKILAVGAFFSSIFIATNSSILQMEGKSKVILTNILVTASLNIVLNMALIPRYGMNGAAMATTASFIFLNLLSISEIKYYLSFIPVRRKMIRIAFISLVPFFAILYVRQYLDVNYFILFIVGLFFVLSYFLLIFILGGLDENDKDILDSISRKVKSYFYVPREPE